jgi:hypothetical protein
MKITTTYHRLVVILKKRGELIMNQYIITTLTECGLHFTNQQSAQDFADKHGVSICQVYYLDEHTPKFIGYGLENENGLMSGNEFIYV